MTFLELDDGYYGSKKATTGQTAAVFIFSVYCRDILISFGNLGCFKVYIRDCDVDFDETHYGISK